MRRMLLALFVTICHLFPASVLAATAPGFDLKKLQDDSLSTLVDLIKMDTSQPAGNEYLATDYLGKRLDEVGIAYKTFESEPGRTNIVARIKGDGSKKPLLLLGHTDVVTVERENWTFDPFSGTVAQGKIFGRGAADDKGIVAVSFEVLIALKRYNIPLSRDVIFLGVADEEGGGGLGITYMIENHLEEISAEFGINEGGRGSIDPQTNLYSVFSIGTAEKTPRRAVLTVEGRAGHGSVPTRDNSIGVLATAVSKLFETPLPMQLNETTRTFFTRLAQTRPKAEADIYRAILAPNPSIETQEKLRDINPSMFSIIRTSVVPTIFEGGYQRNVIPSSAQATLDIRALPDTDPEVMFEQLANIIDDPRVKITPMKVTRPAHSPAPLSTDLFNAFERVLAQQHPSATVLPSMLTGATDSAQLRSVGIATYGFGPGAFLGENNGIHGNDEYLRVEPFSEYARLMWLIVTDVAAQ
ncbi:MAG: M20/M25/M40 family metallo-hydrolase [Pseudomonadales bacterium]|nr:M20/M25/M40 family metallo-hydrolase [Pseudomonadales bacterium]MDG1443331.1 M20/M25/M40 family metallo-hydrolase [Pseudomonadales bacterium]